MNDELEVKRRLLVLLKDPNLVNEYVRQYGLTINVQNMNEIKARKQGTRKLPAAAAVTNPIITQRLAANAAAQAAAQAAAAKASAGKSQNLAAAADANQTDPIFESVVHCPVCGYNKIINYELRAKSQQVIQTAFLVPLYTGASGYSTVDYTYLAVTVCPKCLFASPDKKNFNFPSYLGKGEEISTLPVGVVLGLKDKTPERKTLLPAALNNDDYFKRERSSKVAIESYRLAMVRAETECEMMMPYGYFKRASYALKIAYIMKTDGKDDTEVLKEALTLFIRSYAQSECQSDELEMQVVYLVVALSIRLGDLNQANSYLTAFSKLIADRHEAMKKNPSLNTHWIEKWQDKARYIWEERENPNAFDRLR